MHDIDVRGELEKFLGHFVGVEWVFKFLRCIKMLVHTFVIQLRFPGSICLGMQTGHKMIDRPLEQRHFIDEHGTTAAKFKCQTSRCGIHDLVPVTVGEQVITG